MDGFSFKLDGKGKTHYRKEKIHSIKDINIKTHNERMAVVAEKENKSLPDNTNFYVHFSNF